jgi:hypothetical protein
MRKCGVGFQAFAVVVVDEEIPKVEEANALKLKLPDS